ncbi:MAG: TonB C-terminal domain-containing protein [Candidatus Obscuribacter sp.]|jgi:outer membrane biosynthesis protein TonB|nr:TonB C-terminal domain-containing protein [Candidatus Obscuribacter sp.]MDQ5965645.1 TonB C-terminal protein [Cyanobacteriota bacterium erpe_2018_sw_39hr_WHONDRS-SW48-000098_B_bin.30]MBK7838715.1 TonB C-terminal domain-containing protein [Candidatus Obscuribacter sp.]MBK9202650.1 TonB C-terminal domain-containing protein [Candidatus Obscuribacter sp.]MBK9621249.1 TonB C-terminal domain-containing protein [Candidatus Obscuribacter sp.]
MRLLFGLALSILLLGSVTGCSKGDTDSAVKTTETSTEAANAVPSSPHRVMVSLLDPSKQTREQQEYLLQLQNIILKAWTPGKSDKQYSVSCEFSLTHPGYLAEIHPTSSSGNQRRIEQALDTIRKLAPFPRVPAIFEETPVNFRCDFVYNTGK